MDTELRTGWQDFVTRLLTVLDDLGHQVNLPDNLQDRLCARLDARVAGPDRQAG